MRTVLRIVNSEGEYWNGWTFLKGNPNGTITTFETENYKEAQEEAYTASYYSASPVHIREEFENATEPSKK